MEWSEYNFIKYLKIMISFKIWFQIANSEYHFFIITGPNMGGKTIYLKMIAMLQVLAQVRKSLFIVEIAFFLI